MRSGAADRAVQRLDQQGRDHLEPPAVGAIADFPGDGGGPGNQFLGETDFRTTGSGLSPLLLLAEIAEQLAAAQQQPLEALAPQRQPVTIDGDPPTE